MRPTNPETRIEYRYTTTKGVTVLVSGVPVTTAREDSGEQHKVFSTAFPKFVAASPPQTWRVTRSDTAACLR